MVDETEENPFATHLELAKRWKQMPDDPDYVDQRLADASQFLREQCPDWRNISQATLERIACRTRQGRDLIRHADRGRWFRHHRCQQSQPHGGQFHPVHDIREPSPRILPVQRAEEGAPGSPANASTASTCQTGRRHERRDRESDAIHADPARPTRRLASHRRSISSRWTTCSSHQAR